MSRSFGLRVTIAGLAGVVAACFSKPDAPLQGDARGSADAAHQDTMVMTAGLCATGSAVVLQDFTSGMCGDGIPSASNMTLVYQGGQVQFQRDSAGSDGAGYCTWNPFSAVEGVVAHWPVLAATDFDDNVQLELQTATDDVYLQMVYNNYIKLDKGGEVAGHDLNPQETWWRLRHSGPSLIIGETSVDGGSSWQPVAMTALTSSSFTKMVIGRTQGSSDPVTVALDALYVCQ